MADKTKIVKMLNDELAMEAKAHQLYVALTNRADFDGWEGLASWFKYQSDGETQDYWDFVKIIRDRLDVIPDTPAVPAITIPSSTPIELMKIAMKAEVEVTRHIEEMYDAAPASIKSVLDDKLTEQHETESLILGFLRLYQRAGTDVSALLQVDEHVAEAVPEG